MLGKPLAQALTLIGLTPRWMPRYSPRASLYTSRAGLGVALVALSAILAFNASSRPLYAWDLLAYVGVAQSYSASDPATIHARTYAEVRNHVPEKYFDELTGAGGNRYKAGLTANPGYFIQQLPFYSVKPAYPILIFLLSKTGLSPVTAAYAISRTAYALCGILLFFWVRRYLGTLYALGITSLLVSVPFFVSLPRYSSPDALSALVVLAVMFLMIERNRLRLALALAVLAVTIRPDNILLVFPLALYVAMANPAQRVAAALGGVAAVALYLFQVHTSGNYGWSTLMYHSLVEFLHEPASFTTTLTIVDYLRMYYRAMSPEFMFSGTASGSSYSLILFLLLNVAALASRYREGGVHDRWFVALAINLLFMCCHWILLPADKDRVIVASYLLTLLAFIATTATRRPAGRPLRD